MAVHGTAKLRSEHLPIDQINKLTQTISKGGLTSGEAEEGRMPDTVVEAATQRVLETYALIFDDEKAEAVRETVVDHIERLLSEGETDDAKLAVSALSYLRRQAKP